MLSELLARLWITSELWIHDLGLTRFPILIVTISSRYVLYFVEQNTDVAANQLDAFINNF